MSSGYGTLRGPGALQPIALNGGEGAYLTGSANPFNIGPVLDAIRNYKGHACSVWAMAKPGYRIDGITVQGPTPYTALNDEFGGSQFLTGLVAGRETSATAVTSEIVEYELTVDVTGEGGWCAGTVVADIAQKYYIPHTRVSVAAKPNPGYVFKEWSGEGTTESGDAISGNTSPNISIRMDEDRSVTAKFELIDVSRHEIDINDWIRADALLDGPETCPAGGVYSRATDPDICGNVITFKCNGSYYELFYNTIKISECVYGPGDNYIGYTMYDGLYHKILHWNLEVQVLPAGTVDQGAPGVRDSKFIMYDCIQERFDIDKPEGCKQNHPDYGDLVVNFSHFDDETKLVISDCDNI